MGVLLVNPLLERAKLQVGGMRAFEYSPNRTGLGGDRAWGGRMCGLKHVAAGHVPIAKYGTYQPPRYPDYQRNRNALTLSEDNIHWQ